MNIQPLDTVNEDTPFQPVGRRYSRPPLRVFYREQFARVKSKLFSLKRMVPGLQAPWFS